MHRYRRELLAYCRRLTAGEASAEDVLQQALLQAWVAIERDPEVRDVRAWLYRIVHNVAISTIRRASAESVELDRTEASGGADSEVERKFAAREALAGLAALPELQRRVMLSTALEGRSHEEIAALLGLSHGAVRGLIYRARATLRAAAAALIPGPVIGWAARQEVRGGSGSSGFYEALGGSGTAGVGGLLIKGGAIVAGAGALATAAGLTPIHISHHRHHGAGAPTVLADRTDPSSPAGLTANAGATGGSGGSGSSTTFASVARGGSSGSVHAHRAPGGGRFLLAGSSQFVATPSARSSQGLGPSSTSGRHSSSSGGPGSSGGPDGGSSGGSGSTGGGSSGGHDGGSSGGGDGGSSGGGDGGSSGPPPTTGGSGGTGGGSSGGHDGGSSGGGDGGSSGGGDGGSSGGGTDGSSGGTTTTPTITLSGGGDHSGGGSDGSSGGSTPGGD